MVTMTKTVDSKPPDFAASATPLAAMGYAVFPVVHNEKGPLTVHGCLDATTETAQIDAWADMWPNANVGIHAAGLIVVDRDILPDGSENPWPQDRSQRDSLYVGPVARTPRGGEHHYFRAPAGTKFRNSASKVAPKVDIRTTGGYVVAPPSIANNRQYQWVNELRCTADELPEAPPWLVSRLNETTFEERPAAAPSQEWKSDAAVLERARRYIAKIPGAVSGQGGSNVTFRTACILVLGFGLPTEDAYGLIEEWNQTCSPPWSERELRHKLDDANKRGGDRGYMRNVSPENYTQVPMPEYNEPVGLNDDYYDSLQAGSTEQYDLPSVEGNTLAETKRAPNLKILTAGDLVRDFAQLRRMLIDGLLRDGEVMNVIAPPKLGKSWLVLSLVLAVACGIEWLGRFSTRRGKVLLVDNELHPETLANRLPRVAMAMGLSPEDYGENVSVICLRGRLMDLKQLAFELMQIEPGSYDLIVFDAWYRLLPAGTDENANGDVTQLYNLLESVADRIGSAFTCIHHTSKGNQSEKNITDVGSGAGAQARAADTHMVMRPHEVDGAIVVGASVRSWAPLEPFVMRFEFPVFTIDEHLNPNDLKAVRRGKFKTTGLNDRSDPDDPARAQLMESLKSNLAGMSQSALRKATGFNGPKFLRLVQPLIDARLVEYIPKEDAGTKADIYRAAVGLVGLDPRQTQTNCTDTQTVCGLGLAPLGPDPDLDLVSGVGSAPTWDQFPNMDGDFN